MKKHWYIVAAFVVGMLFWLTRFSKETPMQSVKAELAIQDKRADVERDQVEQGTHLARRRLVLEHAEEIDEFAKSNSKKFNALVDDPGALAEAALRAGRKAARRRKKS